MSFSHETSFKQALLKNLITSIALKKQVQQQTKSYGIKVFQGLELAYNFLVI